MNYTMRSSRTPKSFANTSSEFELNNLDRTTDTLKTSINEVPSQAPTEASRIFIIIGVISGILLLTGIVTFCVLYFGVLITTNSYKGTCSSSSVCNSGVGLICDNTTSSCRCNTSMYWDGYKCTNLLTFGALCYGGSFQCQSNLTCYNQICQCSNTTFSQNGYCIPKLGLNSPCTSCSYSGSCPNCSACSQCQDYIKLYCDSSSLTCLCPTLTHYYDSFSGQCQPKVSYNTYCTSNSTCKGATQGLFCQTTQSGSSCPFMLQSSYCNCLNGTFWNGTNCKSPDTYYATCVGNCSCDTTKLLVCDMQTSDYRCICPTNYYWDTTSLTCLTQLTYYSACTSSNQCMQTKGNK